MIPIKPMKPKKIYEDIDHVNAKKKKNIGLVYENKNPKPDSLTYMKQTFIRVNVFHNIVHYLGKLKRHQLTAL